MTPLINLVVSIGMLVIVPAGLRLIGEGRHPIDRLAVWWPVAALPAAIALWLPRGVLASGLCLPYVMVAVVLVGLVGCAQAGTAPRWGGLIRGGTARGRLAGVDRAAAECAILTACCSPLVAASALMAERAGLRLFGFRLPVLQLTVAHFHVAGFAAALVAGLVGSAARVRAAAVASLCVPVGIGTVFVGFFTGAGTQLAGAIVLTAGMWIVAWVLWREIRPEAPDRLTRSALGISALVLPVTMLLALDWALAPVVGILRLPLVWMVATHGVCNAIGFGLCAVLAFRRLSWIKK